MGRYNTEGKSLVRIHHLTKLRDARALVKDYERCELLVDNKFVRLQTALALEQLQSSESAPLLLRLLQDEEPMVRSAAAQAVGR
jgi:HEAT repeat protein